MTVNKGWLVALCAVAISALLVIGNRQSLGKRTFESADALEKIGAVVLYDLDLKVSRVRIAGESVTDADLVHLSEFRSLKHVILEAPQLTNGCVEHLQRCSSLEFIFVRGTKIDGAGIDAIQAALPKCTIGPGF